MSHRTQEESRDHKALLQKFFEVQAAARAAAMGEKAIVVNSRDGGRTKVAERYEAIEGKLFESVDLVEASGGNAADSGRISHEMLQRAVVFEFTEATFAQFYHAADVYTDEVIAENGPGTWTPYREGSRVPVDFDLEKARGWMQKIHDAGEYLQLPEKMPFDTMYFAWGPDGVRMPKTLELMRANARGMRIVGLIVTRERVIEVLLGAVIDPKGLFGKKSGTLSLSEHRTASGRYGAAFLDQFEDGKWINPNTLYPWLTLGLIGAINANQSLIRAEPRSLADRIAGKRAAKSLRIGGRPPFFYSVSVRPVDMVEAVKASTDKFAMLRDHRWSVRGNWKTRFMRGKLHELTDDLRAQLARRKYRVFTVINPPDAEALSILMHWRERGPAPDEFVAVLRWWQRDHVRGPQDAPFIPSTRRLANQPTASEVEEIGSETT